MAAILPSIDSFRFAIEIIAAKLHSGVAESQELTEIAIDHS